MAIIDSFYLFSAFVGAGLHELQAQSYLDGKSSSEEGVYPLLYQPFEPVAQKQVIIVVTPPGPTFKHGRDNTLEPKTKDRVDAPEATRLHGTGIKSTTARTYAPYVPKNDSPGVYQNLNQNHMTPTKSSHWRNQNSSALPVDNVISGTRRDDVEQPENNQADKDEFDWRFSKVRAFDFSNSQVTCQFSDFLHTKHPETKRDLVANFGSNFAVNFGRSFPEKWKKRWGVKNNQTTVDPCAWAKRAARLWQFSRKCETEYKFIEGRLASSLSFTSTEFFSHRSAFFLIEQLHNYLANFCFETISRHHRSSTLWTLAHESTCWKESTPIRNSEILLTTLTTPPSRKFYQVLYKLQWTSTTGWKKSRTTKSRNWLMPTQLNRVLCCFWTPFTSKDCGSFRSTVHWRWIFTPEKMRWNQKSLCSK